MEGERGRRRGFVVCGEVLLITKQAGWERCEGPLLTSSSDEQNEDQRPHGCCVMRLMRGPDLDRKSVV